MVQPEVIRPMVVQPEVIRPIRPMVEVLMDRIPATIQHHPRPKDASPPSFGTTVARATAATSGKFSTTTAAKPAHLMQLARRSTQPTKTM